MWHVPFHMVGNMGIAIWGQRSKYDRISVQCGGKPSQRKKAKARFQSGPVHLPISNQFVNCLSVHPSTQRNQYYMASDFKEFGVQETKTYITNPGFLP